jgi:hypothetical protein
MPIHRKADGTTVNIAWPPPKESGVKIHTRLVKVAPTKDAVADNEVEDKETGWTLKVEAQEEHRKATFRKVEPAKLMQESDFASLGLGGWLSSLLYEGTGNEKFDDEGWMEKEDGPLWIRALSNDQKRFLLQQVMSRNESQGPMDGGGKQAKARLLRAIMNRFSLSEARAQEAIVWVQGGV